MTDNVTSKMYNEIEIIELDPTSASDDSAASYSLAGTVVQVGVGSGGWYSEHPEYGRGGSEEYPLRRNVEKRIKPQTDILKLRSPEVRIEPTNLCNYTCVMCPRDSHDRPKGYMPMEFYRSLVDEVVLMGAEQITLVNFGEPFIDPTLEDKIFYASQKGLRTYVISNASLFHLRSKSEFAKSHGGDLSKIEAAVLAGLSELRLSFYGANKETYEKIMVRGKFEQVEENIQLFRAAREKYGKEITSPTTNDQVTSPELSAYFLEFDDDSTSDNDREEFLAYTRDFADYIEVWRPHNFGAGRSYRDIEAPVKKTCGRPFSGPVQINWKGIVVPCCYDYNEDIPLGNVAMQTVEEVVRGRPYEALRDSHRDDFTKVPYCDQCDQLCEHNDALIVSTNPKHQGRDRSDIMMSPNTLAGFVMGEAES